MTHGIHSLVLKVAERCNLACKYCYMYQHVDQSYLDRPRFMSDEVFDAMLLRVAEYCDRNPAVRFRFSFHGGEPTLIGPDAFDHLAARLRTRLGDRVNEISMQTNGTLLDDS